MARVEIAHMRVSSGHKVALLLSEEEMHWFIHMLRHSCLCTGTYIATPADQRVFAQALLQSLDRLEASVTAPIEPNDA